MDSGNINEEVRQTLLAKVRYSRREAEKQLRQFRVAQVHSCLIHLPTAYVPTTSSRITSRILSRNSVSGASNSSSPTAACNQQVANVIPDDNTTTTVTTATSTRRVSLADGNSSTASLGNALTTVESSLA